MTGFEPRANQERTALIEIKDLQKTYPLGKDKTKVVFQNLQMKIERGDFVAFLGPSGCGKSTLLRLISGLESPTAGQVQTHTSHLSIVFQEPRLLPWRTVKENVLLPTELGTQKHDKVFLRQAEQKAGEQLSKLGLLDFSDQFPSQLSGGMKMRAALARALLQNPDLLMLDEPLAALDEQTRARLQVELRDLYDKSKMTFVFVTHSIREACFLANKIFIFPTAGPPSLNSQPMEVTVNLPARRTAELRESQSFFEESKRLSELFHQVVGS
jgi:NitT/TauT family transport system ATP-binding protein